MDIAEERVVAAEPSTVFAALNDSSVLQKCIPGCESIEKISESELRAIVAVKIGPVAARFSGKAELHDVAPPDSWAIRGEAAGGAAGFVKGEAKVKLSPHPQGTLLQWTANAKVSGKIAQLGSRLIDSAAKKLAEKFFASLAAHFAEDSEESAEDSKDAHEDSGDAPVSIHRPHRTRNALRIALAFAAIAAVFLFFAEV